MTKFVSLLLLVQSAVLATNVAFAKRWGSEITPELTKFCAKAGGTATVYPGGLTGTCEAYRLRKKSRVEPRQTAVLTADCDCGPTKCFESDRCIDNPKD